MNLWYFTKRTFDSTWILMNFIFVSVSAVDYCQKKFQKKTEEASKKVVETVSCCDTDTDTDVDDSWVKKKSVKKKQAKKK